MLILQIILNSKRVTIKWLILPFLSCLLFSCGRLKNENPEITRHGDTVEIRHRIREGFLIDTVKYLLNDTVIEKMELYENKNQLSEIVSFYTNGKPFEITRYKDGLRNGKHIYYDSLGYKIYEDFFFYGLTVGPIIFYSKKDTLKRYFFSNLQNQTVFEIDYREWKGVQTIAKKCVSYTVQEVKDDTTKKMGVLLYLPCPPKFNFQFSMCVGKGDGEPESIKEVKRLSGELPFLEMILPAIDSTEQYIIKLSIYDSILNQKSVVYRTVD